MTIDLAFRFIAYQCPGLSLTLTDVRSPKLGIYTTFILDIYILRYFGVPSHSILGPKVTLT